MVRIGIIALLHESNTFIRAATEIEDFQTNLLEVGAKVLDAFRGTNHEVGGFLDVLEGAPGVEVVGVFAARAMPYGTISKKGWGELMRRMFEEVERAGRLDGILVAPHGATVSEEHADADGYWLERLRARVGPQVPILGTLDLHANVTQRMVDSTDGLIGYRTNPHLDQRDRGREAAGLLLRTLRGELRPVQALIQLPLCVNIERQATEEPHGRGLWREVSRVEEERSQVQRISCFYGFPYSDVPQMGASVLAIANGDSQQAWKGAEVIAEYWWERRLDFVGMFISIEEAISRTLHCRQEQPRLPVGLLDMGDNVGGGSPGDGTWIAHEWLRSGRGSLLTIVADKEAVQRSQAIGIGGKWEGGVGGKSDPAGHGPPLEDLWSVKHLSDGLFREPEVRHGGYQWMDQGSTAVLQGTTSGITAMVTTYRMAPLSLHQILSQGLLPEHYDAIVIKGVHAPVAAYEHACSKLIRVNTPGVTTADVAQLPYRARRSPMEPFEVCHVPWKS